MKTEKVQEVELTELEKATAVLEAESKRILKEAEEEFNTFLLQFEKKYGLTIGITQPQITLYPVQKK